MTSPVIHGLRPRYKVNDIIRGNCTSKYSRPATNLTWTINDIIVSINIETAYSFRGESFSGTESAPLLSFLMLKLAENLCIHHSCSYNIIPCARRRGSLLCWVIMCFGGKFRFMHTKLCKVNDLITAKTQTIHAKIMPFIVFNELRLDDWRSPRPTQKVSIKLERRDSQLKALKSSLLSICMNDSQPINWIARTQAESPRA